MSSLIKKILDGFSNTNSTESSGEKEIKMINFKTDVPEIDSENAILFRAAALLQKCGNAPGLTATEFHAALLANDIDFDNEDFSKLTSAAIAIETMMALDLIDEESIKEPTVH